MSVPRLLSTYPFPPTLRDALAKAGFQTQTDLHDLGPAALAKELSLPPSEALKVLKIIQTGSDISYKPDNADNGQSALELYRRQHKIKPVYTLCEQLDKMLGGGVIAPQLTEFCGVPGIGKTQLAMQIACDVSIPAAFHGVEGSAVYIDTEGSFVPERVAEIAQGLVDHLHSVAQPEMKGAAAGVTMESILSNIHCYRVYDHTEQLAVIRALPKVIEELKNVRVVIIDSVAFHFRRGFDDMALRSRLLTGMAQQLAETAERYSLAVVLINQVTSKGTDAASGGEKHAPALGESWAHQCTNRVMLQWVNKTERWARLLKSPSQKPTSIQFQIGAVGIRDVGLQSPVASVIVPAAAATEAKGAQPSAAAAAAAAGVGAANRMNGAATGAPLAFVPPPAINRALSRTQSQARGAAAAAAAAAAQPPAFQQPHSLPVPAGGAPAPAAAAAAEPQRRSFQFMQTQSPAPAPAPAAAAASGSAGSGAASYPPAHGSAFTPTRSASQSGAAAQLSVAGQFAGQFGTSQLPAPAAASGGVKRKSTSTAGGAQW